MPFNEDSRVKIPATLNLIRRSYSYLSKDGAVWDESTNIFPDIFKESVAQINAGKNLEDDELNSLLTSLRDFLLPMLMNGQVQVG